MYKFSIGCALYLAGVASLIPYLPIFLSQLGIKPSELAIIYGLIFFITFIKNSLIGFITDKYQLHRLVLIISCCLTGPLYCVLMGIQPTPTEPTNVTLWCPQSNFTGSGCLENGYYFCHDEICRQFQSEQVQLCSPVVCLQTNGSQTTGDYMPTALANQTWVLCESSYNCVREAYSSLTFWLCLVITLSAALFGSNELVLNDTIAMSVLGK